MIGTDDVYTLAQGPSEAALRKYYREWVELNKIIHLVTEKEHFEIKVVSISKPIHDESPWIITGLLPNNRYIFIKYHAGNSAENGEPVNAIAYFWSSLKSQ